jgi:hypothetical protein
VSVDWVNRSLHHRVGPGYGPPGCHVGWGRGGPDVMHEILEEKKVLQLHEVYV